MIKKIGFCFLLTSSMSFPLGFEANYDEPQLSFHLAGFSLSENYLDASKPRSGFQNDDTISSEFLFSGRFETLGDSYLKPADHFYL